MKFTFVIPSREFLASAGARIRYLRMVTLMEEAGHTLDLVPIADFGNLRDPGEVVVFSKCFDARAIVFAAQCRAQNRLVGVDLFDDYFSQSSDSRMTMYRTWLAQMLDRAHLAICSTPRMAELVASLRPQTPVHVFNDPASDLRLDAMPEMLASKRDRALQERRIKLGWFGIGDNPFFSVGLEDLTAFGARFACLATRGWTIDCTVLTNARALDADRLAAIGNLPFRVQVELWTEKAETELLLDSFCCFLPVNAQPFSIAKSLNRAISALTAGCQVVWAGYPLYSRVDDLLYADPAELVNDLEQGTLRLSDGSLGRYAQLMEELASIEVEVTRLLTFVEGLGRPAASEGGKVRALVHGHQTVGDAHKAARKLGILSVATPFAPPTLTYDVIFTGHPADGGLLMLIAEPVRERLLPDTSVPIRFFGEINKTRYVAVDWPQDTPLAMKDWSSASLPDLLAAYRGIFPAVHRRLEAVFGPVEMMISESSKLPFDPGASA